MSAVLAKVGVLVYGQMVTCKPGDPSCPDPTMHGRINGEPVGPELPNAISCTDCGRLVYLAEVTVFPPGWRPTIGERHPRDAQRVFAVVEKIVLSPLDRAMLGITSDDRWALEDHSCGGWPR